jgi:DNA helicase-2/ATP-dependent DNA helicase PcrA
MSGLRSAAGAGAPCRPGRGGARPVRALAELQASEDLQDASRIENLTELVAVAREYDTQHPDGTLADFLEQVSLVADADQIPEGVEHGGMVTLMTLHTAKGLEFPVVFLTGLEENVFPHERSAATSGSSRRSAARLRRHHPGREAAVPTRAGPAWSATAYHQQSRFLSEVPAELIEGGTARRARPASERFASRRSGMNAAGTRPVPVLAPDDMVNHDSYGLGRVLSVEGRGDDPEAKIDFGGDYGIKHLVLRYAPIEKL